MISAYKQRRVVGGVYDICCQATGRHWVKGDVDLAGAKNRFAFSAATGSCVAPAMAADWAEQGAGSFRFRVLEELEKKEGQSDREFRQDVETLEELWRERFAPEQLY